VTEEAIVLFLSGNAIPLVAEFNQETAQKIFSGEIKSHLLLFISSAAEDFSAKVDIAKAIAKDHKGEMIFVKINTDEEDHKRIMELFGLDESELPLMRILKFKPEQN
jgi:protein disulfide-isomerase A1